MNQWLRYLFFLFFSLGAFSCYAQDRFDNSKIDWKLTPLGKFLPTLEETELSEFKEIANDESKVLELLKDESTFAFAHIALCQLKSPLGPSSATQSLGKISANYFGLLVQATFDETRYSTQIHVEYPDVSGQISKLRTLWKNNDAAVSSNRIPTIRTTLKEKFEGVVNEMSEVTVSATEAKLTTDVLAFPSHGLGTQRPVLPKVEMDAVKKQLTIAPLTILDKLSNSEQLPVVHVALTNCFFPDDIYSVFKQDGQTVYCNGLTIEIRVKFKNGSRNQTIQYPKIELEKQHIKKFWSLVLEDIGSN